MLNLHTLVDRPQFAKLRSLDKNSPMIVLNACQVGREGYTYTSLGGFAQAFLKGGASAFIGPLWLVGDRSARIFTETLYKELIKGLTLSEATVIAREQARHFGDATWLAYAVYGHPHLRIKLDINQIPDFSSSPSLPQNPQYTYTC